ncbi:hypothetical protein TRFO_42222 [Tritrichomonas foetus]|uniref:Uncharacterized protein n=1 Tax=Tritrichomonas foetus TaxID=1144522 RepID=A0A1J4KXJ4_9EUKA|nr:hypothetical protein TRFO_42222 [Tritrichomonas foetus]|eukprot:OHT15898.1 hypothetical protein TRFO_42222 [Tritrichomonas foetus]
MRRGSETTQAIEMLNGQIKQLENKAFSMFQRMVALTEKWTEEARNRKYKKGQVVSNYCLDQIGKVATSLKSNNNNHHKLINGNCLIGVLADTGIPCVVELREHNIQNHQPNEYVSNMYLLERQNAAFGLRFWTLENDNISENNLYIDTLKVTKNFKTNHEIDSILIQTEFILRKEPKFKEELQILFHQFQPHGFPPLSLMKNQCPQHKRKSSLLEENIHDRFNKVTPHKFKIEFVEKYGKMLKNNLYKKTEELARLSKTQFPS